MARPKVPVHDIVKLWSYYFEDTAPDAARRDATKVSLAVAGTTKRVFLRRDDEHRPGREPTDKLFEMGQYFTGAAINFNQMYDDELTDLTIDTGNGRHVYIIPFRTEADDSRVIDTVVVLYGRELSTMAYMFHHLSEKGWDATLPLLIGYRP